MTMIRRATPSDIDQLVTLARLEHAASAMRDQPFDELVVRSRFVGTINGLATAVFVSETDGKLDGVIAGMVQQNLHNRYSTVYELMWFSLSGSGIKLLQAIKDWANRMRATALVIHNYAGIKSTETFNKVMARKGFTPLGVSYVAALEN